MQRASFLTFSVGEEQFCISVNDIQEIAAVQDFQTIPGAPRCIKGIAGIRGKMMTLIEVAEVFGIKVEPASPFSALLLAAPYAGIGLSVYSHIDMRSSSSSPDVKRTKGSSQPHTIDIDGVPMVHLNVHEIFSFCEQKILNLFKVGNRQMTQRETRNFP